MDDRDNEGLNGQGTDLATAADSAAADRCLRTGKILEAPPLVFSPYLLSSIFTAFLMIHLWASLAPIPANAAFEINDKVSHYLAFAWLGTILVWSLISCSLRWPERIRLQKIWLWAALALFLYGLAIEGWQNLLPHRQFEWLDLAANAAGIVTVLILSFITKLKIDRGKRRRENREAEH